MPWSLLLQWAKLAGMFGVAIGAVAWTFNNIINRRLTTPNQQESAKLLRLLIILTFSIGVLGLLVYLVIMIFVPEPKRSAYEVDSVRDVVDFSMWKPVKSLDSLLKGKETSVVIRSRRVEIRRIVSLNEDFVDRNTTTGREIMATIPKGDAAYQEVIPKSGRTRHEYMLTLSKEVFDKNNPYVLEYTLKYNGGWITAQDDWVGKVMQYPTRNYSYKLIFSTPWKSARVNIQPPGSTINNEVTRVTNNSNSLVFSWSSNPNMVLAPGTRIAVTFEWPPLTGHEPRI